MSSGSEQLLLREARPQDAVRLAEIESRSQTAPTVSVGAVCDRDSADQRERLDKEATRFHRLCENGAPTNGLVVVAEHAGQVCGFVLYTLVLDEGSINNIVVDPDFQGRGFGRQLLRHALAVMRQNRASRCLLEVRASNDAALALYNSEWFVLDGKRPGYYSTRTGGREDALLMSRQL